VTSQGHPHAIFQRALERGNVAAAWAAAYELKHISLADALALTLLIAEREPERFGRVSARWFARYCTEAQPDLDEAQAVVALLRALSSPRPGPAVGRSRRSGASRAVPNSPVCFNAGEQKVEAR
jgi:hypothetical protein